MEPIAIVGLAFQMPQEAQNETGLWEIIESGRNVMTEWPSDRVTVDEFHDQQTSYKRSNRFSGRGAHFTRKDPAVFDAPFFSMSGREAAATDPQQRWALEASFHALENAGMTLEQVRGSRMAVFTSSFSDDYTRMTAKDPEMAPPHSSIGSTCSALANRLSWFFDTRGPSMYVDTACSSGIVALDLAQQAMASGDTDLALVVGSNALLTPDLTLSMGALGFLSPDSRCHSFDASADGYSRGEGVVALVLKPLDQAVAAGDMIRAIVRATASNQDGRTPVLTQPSATAQESLIRHVYKKAALSPDSTRYFEAHGTGTPVGDPIEATAIGRVFGPTRSPQDPLYVGSIKANIGHLEAASGLAALVKCVLMLERGIIPPVAMFNRLNPDIDSTLLNIDIPTRCINWPGEIANTNSHSLRRVSVQSFGYGGTNAHAILDDAASYLLSRGLVGHHQVQLPGEVCIL